MKYSLCFALILGLFLIVPNAFAEEEENSCNSFKGHFLNSCNPQIKEKRQNRLGGGTEVPLWINKKFIIEQEFRYNDDGTFATYAMINPQMEKGLFQHAWDGIKKVFGLFFRK